jgi:predicted PurR-regulated permease PerM
MTLLPADSTPFYKKLAFTLFNLVAAGYLAVLAKEILVPLLFSMLFSIVLLPVAKFFETQGRMPRSVASLLAVFLFLFLISSVFYLLGAQMTTLAEDWPLFEKQLDTTLTDLQRWVAREYHIDSHKQLNYIQNAADGILASGTEIIGETFLSLSSTMLFLVFTIIDLFFLLLYRRLILNFLVTIFKEKNASTVYAVIEQVQTIIRKYILGLLLEMGIVTLVACLAFLIFGIKYALLLGLLTGTLNLIPYLGIFTALLLSILISFATSGAGSILIVVIILVSVHLLDSNILLPLVVGSKVKINALVTVLGVIVGEMIWGISGMFLSIPVIAVTKIIVDRVESLQPWGILLGEESKENPVTVVKE